MECKDTLFNNFKNRSILGIRRKWKRIKIKTPKSNRFIHLKGKNILYLHFNGYDLFYKKAYPFTGKYGNYALNYCHYKYRDDYVLIDLNHNAIKNKGTYEIYNDILRLLESIGIDINFLEINHKLNRIDYKYDFECEYKPIAEKQAIMCICSKTRNTFYGVSKENLKKGIGIKYKPTSSYTEIIVYDKGQERRDKLKRHNSSQPELEIKEYENVFRTELRLKSKRLYYNQKYTLKIPKTLNNYYNENVADECFLKYVEPIFYLEPFYRIDYAILSIQTDRRLTEKEAQKLCKLVTDINEKGYTRAKNEYDYCDDTFEKHIKLLRSIGINPLTFDKNINLAILHNFTTKNVCRDFTIYESQLRTKKKTFDEWGFEIC